MTQLIRCDNCDEIKEKYELIVANLRTEISGLESNVSHLEEELNDSEEERIEFEEKYDDCYSLLEDIEELAKKRD